MPTSQSGHQLFPDHQGYLDKRRVGEFLLGGAFSWTTFPPSFEYHLFGLVWYPYRLFGDKAGQIPPYANPSKPTRNSLSPLSHCNVHTAQINDISRVH
jgi:hypothetical protein